LTFVFNRPTPIRHHAHNAARNRDVLQRIRRQQNQIRNPSRLDRSEIVQLVSRGCPSAMPAIASSPSGVPHTQDRDPCFNRCHPPAIARAPKTTSDTANGSVIEKSPGAFLASWSAAREAAMTQLLARNQTYHAGIGLQLAADHIHPRGMRNRHILCSSANGKQEKCRKGRSHW
jgi:hypothetical protein